MENKLKIFVLNDKRISLKQEVRNLDEGFIVQRKIKHKPCTDSRIFPYTYDVSCTQILSKESPDERVATIFESKRNEGLRYVAVMARGDTGLPEAVSIAYSLGFIPKNEYKGFSSE